MYFQCAPQKSCELQPKIGTNFFKGKKVTLDPRPINLWGPPFLEVHTCPTSRCLTYFLEAPFVASKFEPPKWSKRLLYCSWCICIYILMCTYKYTIYIFFFKTIFHSLILYPYWSQHFLEMGSFFTILLRLGIFGESEGLLLLAPLAKQPLTAWSLRGWKEPLTAECMKPWIFNFGEQESST